MRLLLVPVIVALCVGLVPGCSSERPTRGPSEDTFPTLNLSDAIVLRIVGPFDSLSYFDSTDNEFGLQLPMESVSELGPNFDIQLNYLGPEPCRRAIVYAFDNLDSEWVEIENQRTASPCFGDGGGSTLTLLPFRGHTPGSFVSALGLIRLKGDLFQPSATLLQVHPNYRPMMLPLTVLGSSIEWVGDGAILQTLQRGDPEWLVDSVIHLDRSGNRTFAGDLGAPSGLGMDVAWSGSGLWGAVPVDNGTRYSLLDDFWQPILGFTQYWSDSIFRGEFFWVNGEIWIPAVRYSGSRINPTLTPFMTVVDPWKSIDSGFSVVTRTVVLDQSLEHMGKVAFDGSYICTMTRDGIIRLTTNGEIVDTLPLPVLPAFSITWDGEAFWIIHRGPPSANTDYDLLSRFYPR